MRAVFPFNDGTRIWKSDQRAKGQIPFKGFKGFSRGQIP
jgi:hypothetical protein